LGEVKDDQLETIQQDLSELANSIFPLDIEFGEQEMFGPKNDIPVLLVGIKDENKKNILDDFYRKHGKPEYGIERETQNFHVTVKGIVDEVGSLSNARLTTIFLKPLGPYDPIWQMKI
jgi:2'-5' RNA ligase